MISNDIEMPIEDCRHPYYYQQFAIVYNNIYRY